MGAQGSKNGVEINDDKHLAQNLNKCFVLAFTK